MKNCTKCMKSKNLSEFHKCKRNKSGYRAECKNCRLVYNETNAKAIKTWKSTYYRENKDEILAECREDYKANPTKKKESSKAYQNNNKDKIRQSKKQYRTENRDAVLASKARYRQSPEGKITLNKWFSHRLATDMCFRIAKNLRGRVNQIVKKNMRAGSAVRDLGCSVEEFKIYIENLFQPGMTWENYGKGKGKWCYDHIYPLSLLDLKDRTEFLKACHYTNIQPMWYVENSSKNNRLDYNPSTSARQAILNSLKI